MLSQKILTLVSILTYSFFLLFPNISLSSPILTNHNSPSNSFQKKTGNEKSPNLSNHDSPYVNFQKKTGNQKSPTLSYHNLPYTEKKGNKKANDLPINVPLPHSQNSLKNGSPFTTSQKKTGNKKADDPTFNIHLPSSVSLNNDSPYNTSQKKAGKQNANGINISLPSAISKKMSLYLPIIPGKDSHENNGNEKVFDLTITKGSYAPDGFKRDMFLVNGQFPGPLIECNKGDTIVMNIKNELDEDTSMHSHGIFQRGTPWYDGVPGQSQCGIPSKGSFTYKYKVEQSGTYWYHSHSRTQYIEGIVGPLIIHDPEDPYKDECDEELIVLLQDWYHTGAKKLLATFLSPESQGNEPSPDNGLINGRNSYNCSWAPEGSDCVNNAPLTQFNFVHGKKYRIRIINTSAFSAFIFSIDEHPLDVIEVEGMMTKRHTVHRIPINVAQRYSVIVTAKQTVGQYWMRAEMQTDCYAVVPDDLNPLVKAIVAYNGSTDQSPSSTAWTDDVESCVDLNANDLKPCKPQKIPNPSKNFTTTAVIVFQPDADDVVLGYINNSTYKLDNYPTILKVYNGVKKFATDQNVIIIEKDEVVDIILKNEDPGEHPFHLHGHVCWVLGSGENGTQPDYSKLNTKDPIQRDTITVPAGGWTILRFISNNPGVWGFHCHIDWHVEAGLLMQFVTQPDGIKKLKPPNDWKALCPNSFNSSNSSDSSNSSNSTYGSNGSNGSNSSNGSNGSNSSNGSNGSNSSNGSNGSNSSNGSNGSNSSNGSNGSNSSNGSNGSNSSNSTHGSNGFNGSNRHHKQF